MNLLEAADRFGTPVYVYDLAEVAAALRDLRGALPSGAIVHYSLKANPHPRIAALLAEAGLRAEVSSPGELAAALAAGFPATEVTYSGPAKTDAEIDAAVRAGVRRFSAESHRDLVAIDRAAARHGADVACLLRINADRPVPGMGLAMAGVGTKFGVDHSEVLRDAKRYLGTRHARVIGLHLYMGTNLSTEQVLLEQFATAAAVAEDLARVWGTDFEEVDLGGGFGTPYARPGARPVFPGLRRGLESLLADRLPGWRSGTTAVSFESGRYLAGSCGTLLTRVVDVKRSKGERFVLVDSGVHHLGGMSGLRRLPPVGARVVAVGRESGSSTESRSETAGPAETTAPGSPDGPADPAHLVGPLCTPVDRWTGAADLPELSVGDLLAVPNTGAYGLTASLVGFLGYPAPPEVVLAEDGTVTADRLTLTRQPVEGAPS